MKDYTETYYNKLKWLDDCDEMPFTKEELIGKLPKILPKSTYHGDLTLENIMYTDPGFHLIDPVTIEYDSYVFDIAKLRQDLECKWFLRNTNIKLEVKLQNLQNKLRKQYEKFFDDNLLILMLLRVYLHTKQGDDNHKFIMKEINRLWK
jgi:5-methylthioribose kinase